MTPKRDWALARVKRDREGGRCRICRSAVHVELAHIIGRTHDFYWEDGETKQRGPSLHPNGQFDPVTQNFLMVLPDRVVPLCREHHRQYDAHVLDLLGHLTKAEEAQAVRDVGLENARIRICPSAYSPRKVPVG